MRANVMEIIQVTDKATVDEFHKLPYKIYKNDKNWVPPLRMMIEDMFDPKKNARLEKGNARRWVLRKSGETIGRIAAFHDPAYSISYDQPTGCIGFFECINDQGAAEKLFDTARKWLKSEGMEAMDGPVNFGENFFHWGLLADGYVQQGFGMQYHPPYYRSLFENYGFQTYYEQYSYHLDITSPDLPQRFWKIAAWVAKKPEYEFVPFSYKNQEKFIFDFIEIHKQAWGKHDNYKEIDPQDLRNLLAESKFILDEEFIWYVYHKKQPIAFFMMIPDLNQIVRYLRNGKMNLWNILKFIILKKMRIISRCRVLVMGVVPKFQNLGIESGIFYKLKEVLTRKIWYNEMELSWVGDFNPKMIALFNSVGGKQAKTHLTLRYLFDRDKPFKRAPIIGEA